MMFRIERDAGSMVKKDYGKQLLIMSTPPRTEAVGGVSRAVHPRLERHAWLMAKCLRQTKNESAPVYCSCWG